MPKSELPPTSLLNTLKWPLSNKMMPSSPPLMAWLLAMMPVSEISTSMPCLPLPFAVLLTMVS